MRLTFFTVILSCSLAASAQIAPENLDTLRQYEKELAELSMRIVNDSLEEGRGKALYAFIPKLVEALEVKGSFDYPFDSVNISILKPEDNSFRIFTLHLRWGNGLFRQFGAIQMNSPDKLVLYPLFDYSDSLAANLETRITNPETWYGAVYYNIYPFKQKGKSYYLLFGFDQNDLFSNKKLIEVLHFEKGKPVFGAPVFQFADSVGNVSTINRFVLEYKKDAVVGLNYSEMDQMIVFDHLRAPEERLSDLKFTFIPDGTYEGFQLKKGMWQHVEKIQTLNINEDNNPPVPEPRFD